MMQYRRSYSQDAKYYPSSLHLSCTFVAKFILKKGQTYSQMNYATSEDEYLLIDYYDQFFHNHEIRTVIAGRFGCQAFPVNTYTNFQGHPPRIFTPPLTLGENQFEGQANFFIVRSFNQPIRTMNIIDGINSMSFTRCNQDAHTGSFFLRGHYLVTFRNMEVDEEKKPKEDHPQWQLPPFQPSAFSIPFEKPEHHPPLVPVLSSTLPKQEQISILQQHRKFKIPQERKGPFDIPERKGQKAEYAMSEKSSLPKITFSYSGSILPKDTSNMKK